MPPRIITLIKEKLQKMHTYIHYMYFFFFDELRKFTISDFPKQMHLGYIYHFIYFPTPCNQSTLHQNIFVLAALAQAVG